MRPTIGTAAAVGGVSGAHRPGTIRRLVDGVDHVYVPMAQAADGFAVLTEELALPVMWPFTSFGDFASGGVSLGGIKLEVIEANSTAPWCLAQDPPQIQGVAFRPSTTVDDAYLAEVDARSIPRTPPEHYPDPRAPRWTNVYFRDLIGDTAGVFVCDYHLPQPKDLDLRRRLLAGCAGGRMGVLDAVELVIATRDLDAASARWQRLLDPLQRAEPGIWHPVTGPAVRLVPGDGERVDHLLLAVRSAARARALWNEVSGHALRRFPLRFVERQALPGTAVP